AHLVPRGRAGRAGHPRRSDGRAPASGRRPRNGKMSHMGWDFQRARGFVFDLDGTLTANMPLHAEAFARFTERHGLPPFTLEMRARLDGKRNSDIFPILFERELSAEQIRLLSGEKEALYREISRGRLTPLPGLLPLLQAMERRGLPAAVATSAPAQNVPHTLGELGLLTRLQHIVRSDQVPRGKPHPDACVVDTRL